MKDVLPYVVLAMVFYTLGEWSSKLYANTHRAGYVVLGMLGYGLNALLFFPALKHWNSLSMLGTIWNTLYAVITLVLALGVFHEAITIRQMVGLAFALVAIILLSQ